MLRVAVQAADRLSRRCGFPRPAVRQTVRPVVAPLRFYVAAGGPQLIRSLCDGSPALSGDDIRRKFINFYVARGAVKGWVLSSYIARFKFPF